MDKLDIFLRNGKYKTFDNFKTVFMSQGGDKINDPYLLLKLVGTKNRYEVENIKQKATELSNDDIRTLENFVKRNLDETNENRNRLNKIRHKLASNKYLKNVLQKGVERKKEQEQKNINNKITKNEENRLNHEEKTAAATAIQSVVRGRKVRKELERNKAARTIQKHMRARAPRLNQTSRFGNKSPDQIYQELEGKVTRSKHNKSVNKSKLRENIKSFNTNKRIEFRTDMRTRLGQLLKNLNSKPSFLNRTEIRNKRLKVVKQGPYKKSQ